MSVSCFYVTNHVFFTSFLSYVMFLACLFVGSFFVVVAKMEGLMQGFTVSYFTAKQWDLSKWGIGCEDQEHNLDEKQLKANGDHLEAIGDQQMATELEPHRVKTVYLREGVLQTARGMSLDALKHLQNLSSVHDLKKRATIYRQQLKERNIVQEKYELRRHKKQVEWRKENTVGNDESSQKDMVHGMCQQMTDGVKIGQETISTTSHSTRAKGDTTSHHKIADGRRRTNDAANEQEIDSSVFSSPISSSQTSRVMAAAQNRAINININLKQPRRGGGGSPPYVCAGDSSAKSSRTIRFDDEVTAPSTTGNDGDVDDDTYDDEYECVVTERHQHRQPLRRRETLETASGRLLPDLRLTSLKPPIFPVIGQNPERAKSPKLRSPGPFKIDLFPSRLAALRKGIRNKFTKQEKYTDICVTPRAFGLQSDCANTSCMRKIQDGGNYKHDHSKTLKQKSNKSTYLLSPDQEFTWKPNQLRHRVPPNKKKIVTLWSNIEREH